MKKIIISFIISFIILIQFNISSATTATVNVTAVRIRETASSDSKILTNIYEDDEVEILEQDGEWYKVQYQDITGYVKSEFLTTIENESTSSQNTVEEETTTAENETIENSVLTETTEEPVQENTQTVAEFSLNQTITLTNSIDIRLLPNLSSTKTELMQGSTATIEVQIGNWYKITAGTKNRMGNSTKIN